MCVCVRIHRGPTGEALQVFEGDQVGADVLLPVDGLRQQEVQVVQRHGGHQGEHAVLVGDLHRDMDAERGRTEQKRRNASADNT